MFMLNSWRWWSNRKWSDIGQDHINCSHSQRQTKDFFQKTRDHTPLRRCSVNETSGTCWTIFKRVWGHWHDAKSSFRFFKTPFWRKVRHIMFMVLVLVSKQLTNYKKVTTIAEISHLNTCLYCVVKWQRQTFLDKIYL